MNKKEIKTCLGVIYGFNCFITDLKDDLSYHHLVKKCDGGEFSIQNGVLLAEPFHKWLNYLEITDYCYYLLLNDTIMLAKDVVKSDDESLKEKFFLIKKNVTARFISWTNGG